ncbi:MULTISPECIES: HisA/HisF-related TIM barrel protein [Dermabacter]|uniref:1-(5-phosphoribosyl)-5-[(5-phosphoribosylamino)methylideneamino]imidazole-4-carboxamide isomerase n=1 Tax=Dermabacter vaginalis TaxID=1630135 RepID=A0A1B0ZJG9_9MICO|nr:MULTISPECIES: HisA/HisF-related TIM barrel protein [Dermabacter]ANP28141.1 1-(5-phosphoribosyl)-5-[(5-phosphoribosylamino)methylideneamino]imidazole-4-carboxamide isomerase [Dermabacter vaginalis]RUP85590.1 bifunctional 1-(5-phosphoribosyl)-5-((5-phosphoribosylamino)methylideneamino)imidazole-4-carboxamide isomerase/phosphoribosylanthranilate isomerase PriA [Dermabacter sp. HSID17554]
MPRFDLFPAVDIAGGTLARAPRGGASTDPLDIVRTFARDGASWLHLADLDRAFGRGTNDAQLAAIVREAHALGVRTQYSGGIDSGEALAAALASDCARVNISAAALAERDFVREAIRTHGDRIAVCVDVRGASIHPRGRKEPIGDLDSTLTFLRGAGCARLIVTEIERDGALSGPPLALLERVSHESCGDIIASGGAASLGDIEALVRLSTFTRVRGAIVGRALLEGRFTLSEALERVRNVEARHARQPSERTP